MEKTARGKLILINGLASFQQRGAFALDQGASPGGAYVARKSCLVLFLG
jgi:hypothetical protein